MIFYCQALDFGNSSRIMASKPPGSPPKLTDGNLLNSGKNELLIKVSYSEEFGTVAACKLDEFLLAVQSVRHQLIILLEMSIEIEACSVDQLSHARCNFM